MVEYILQGAVVNPQHPVEELLRSAIEPALRLVMRATQEAAAERGGEGHGNDARDQNRRCDGNRKFLEQPSQHTAQEQHGDEHRRE